MIAPTKSRPRLFYVAMAIVAALIAIVGFSRRYFLALAAGTLDVSALVHLHAILAFGWVVLFIVQTVLVTRKRTALHRSLGLAGVALGAMLALTAVEIAILLLARELKQGGPPHLQEFFATLLSWVLMFACLFGFAIASVNKPETHKRLMLLATIVTLAAAFARIIQFVSGDMTRLARNDLAALPCDALVLIAILYDWKVFGKIHGAYIAGGSFIVATQLVTLAFRSTPMWFDAARWFARLAG